MKPKPILFSGPMVRALVREAKKPGTGKTQTRRLIKLPNDKAESNRGPWEVSTIGGAGVTTSDGKPFAERACLWHPKAGTVVTPRWSVGDVLYVRETWCPANTDNGPAVLFKADGHRRYLVEESYPVDYDKFPAGRGAWSAWASEVESGSTKAWRPAIHMPTWVSRITLRVTDVRVQRLQDLTEADAIAEGAMTLATPFGGWGLWTLQEPEPAEGPPARIRFAHLWNTINGAAGKRWADDPYVCALTFSVHMRNVNELLKQREAA